MSPYPIALAAVEIMRPRYQVFFVPFEGTAADASTQQRPDVGRLFLESLAAWAGRRCIPRQLGGLTDGLAALITQCCATCWRVA